MGEVEGIVQYGAESKLNIIFKPQFGHSHT